MIISRHLIIVADEYWLKVGYVNILFVVHKIEYRPNNGIKSTAIDLCDWVCHCLWFIHFIYVCVLFMYLFLH